MSCFLVCFVVHVVCTVNHWLQSIVSTLKIYDKSSKSCPIFALKSPKELLLFQAFNYLVFVLYVYFRNIQLIVLDNKLYMVINRRVNIQYLHNKNVITAACYLLYRKLFISYSGCQL